MQGLIEFAVLIEQADPKHRDKILSDSTEQDPDFVAKVMRKVVFFDELIYLDNLILAEILSRTSPKLVAYAIYGMEENFRKAILKQLGYRDMKLAMDEEEKMPSKVSREFVLGAQRQVLRIARSMEAENKFVFELTECPRFKARKAV